MSKSNKTTPNVPTLRFSNFVGAWQKTSMGNVCSFSKGYGISKDDLSIEGAPCILYGELYTTYKTAIAKKIKSKTNLNPEELFHSKKNDVIIPCSGETAEDIATSVCIPYDGVLLGGDLTVIRSNLDGAFLSNQLNSARKYDIARIAQGKSIVHLQAEELKKIDIAFPSIDEQRKISGFIDLIDDRIAVQNKIISKYETLGILTTNDCYCVSPAYTTYYIRGVDSFYLQEYLIELNPLLSVRYMVTSARQGKAVNKDDLMKHHLAIHSDLEQNKIHQFFQRIYDRLLIEKRMLSALQKQKAFLLQSMFI